MRSSSLLAVRVALLAARDAAIEPQENRTISPAELPRDNPLRDNVYHLADGEVCITAGFCVVEHVIFQGKDLGFCIYLHPHNLVPLLVQSIAADDLTPEQRQILVNYRSLKSGYRPKYTQAQLDPLIAKGFLRQTKNGATEITNMGRAVVANVR